MSANYFSMASVFAQHQEEFVKLLQQKGYVGTFHLQDGLHQWSHTDVLSRCLNFHREKCLKQPGQMRPFILVNNVRYKHDGDYTECSMNVDYNPDKGFRVKGLDYKIIRIQSHGIDLIDNHSLPEAGMLETIKKQSDLVVPGHQRVNGKKDANPLSSKEQYQVASFVDLLERKGYVSMFDFSARNDDWQIMDRARGCLVYYLLHAKEHQDLPGFSMRCFSYYRDDHDFIETTLRMRYDQRTGFDVISLTLGYPGQQSSTIPLLSVMDLPDNHDLEEIKRMREVKTGYTGKLIQSTQQKHTR